MALSVPLCNPESSSTMNTTPLFTAVPGTRSVGSTRFGSLLRAFLCFLLTNGPAAFTADGPSVSRPLVLPASGSDLGLQAPVVNPSGNLSTDERLMINPTETNSVVVTWSTNLPPARLLSRVGRYVFENIDPDLASLVYCDDSPIDFRLVCYSAAWERVDAAVTITPQGRYQVIAPVRLESQFYRLELLGPLESSTWAATMLEGGLVEWPRPVKVWFSAGAKSVRGQGAGNGFSGIFESATSGTLSMKSLAFTRSFASEAATAIDDALSRVLLKADHYRIVGGQLELLKGAEVLGRFTAVSAAP